LGGNQEIKMLYVIGGAPRTGKSILGQRLAAKLHIGWVSTDLLMEILRLVEEEGVKNNWNATPEAISQNATWFFPYLDRFISGIIAKAESYLIEGVDFLPAQITHLAESYPINSIFLGCLKMTLERFDQFPGHSPGYAKLPDEVRRQMAQDIPIWSKYIQQEAHKYGYSFIDMSDNFSMRVDEAETLLMSRFRSTS
jgi:2-phosphoglycerate kinase